MKRLMIGSALFLLVPNAGVGVALAGCYDLVQNSPDRKFAKEYPYPLTMRWNIVNALEMQMVANGDIKSSRKIKRTRLPAFQIKSVQKKLNLSPTGCVSWSLIDNYLD